MRRSTSSLKIITSLTALVALCVPAYVFGLETGGWREGVQRDIPAALDAAMQQGGRVLVCFSSDPVADDSAVAQLLAAREIRDWANDQKVTLTLIEFARANAPDVQRARSRFVELTRQYKIAGSPTWLFLGADGKELGRLCAEDVLFADSRGDLAQKPDPGFWLKQATSVLKTGRAAPPPDPVKEPTWFARFGGQGWTGKETVSDDEGAMNYTLFVPDGLAEGQKYPLLIWLHGGARSDGNEIADEDAVHLSVAASRPGRKACVLVPSAIAGQIWAAAPAGSASPKPSPTMKLILKLVETLPRDHPIDPRKVVVMGESAGAFGCWALLEYYPDHFAGAVINSGGGDPSMVNRLTKQRIWIIHGEKDQRVPVVKDQEMFDALIKVRGGNPRTEKDGDWLKASDAADTLRFWRHAESGHVPMFNYSDGIEWVLNVR